MKITLERSCTSDTAMGIYYRPENTYDAFILGRAMDGGFKMTCKVAEDEKGKIIEWVMLDPAKLIGWLGRAKPTDG